MTQSRSRRRRPTPSQIAYVVQAGVALALAAALGVAIRMFFLVADRLPGGATRYIYLPIAMAAFLLLALWRAWRSIQAAHRQRPPATDPDLEIAGGMVTKGRCGNDRS